ncbi:uroporphyrinogen decarboxylase family protein [Pelosinus sp. IPA-1]|uniref:uroporphyrinogen decarboxylase family protein n=1 Tax=Pelosinus sp. IPA-1 TaxID=3029569 RepID=UPI00243618BB|nr:uroporphyrinogen decarboxylase family protein [Pelosinus sp. IPA-1]GMB00671.1 methylcobamide:CoM methyltransferase [Pelosinus sp. IPA-1]
MNRRNVVLQTVSGKTTEKLKGYPLSTALLSGGTWAFRQKGLTLRDGLDVPEEAAKTIVEINQKVGSDIVWPGSGYHNLLVEALGGSIKFRPQGNIDVIEPLLHRIADLDSIEIGSLDKNRWIASVRQMIETTDRTAGKKYLVGTSSWGPFTLAGQFLGVEKLMIGLYKDKASIHALLDFASEVCFQYLAPTVAKGASILSIAEPTASGDLISLRHFEEFVAPYLTKVNERLQQLGAVITLHICGNITDRLSVVPHLGVDLLSVDYKVSLRYAKEVLANKVALAGNVNPMILRDRSMEEVVVAARECIVEAGQEGKFVLMPGCDIPPSVPLENVQAFIRGAHDYIGDVELQTGSKE